VNRGGGLVVDTFFDLPHTRRLMDLYASVWPEPARRVVNSHHNGDHCWGNQLFPGAEIIGHRLCRDHFTHDSPEGLQAVRGLLDHADPDLAELARRLQEWDFTGIELTPPTTVLDERMDLDLGGIPTEILYVGPAHTAGDVIVHLPEQGIVFTGDILFRRCTPIGWEGTFDRWIAALDRIVALEPHVVVPGHGPLCGVEGPREMKAYLEYVRGEARRFHAAGVSAEEAARRIDLGPYADWTEPERIVFNVARAYRELDGVRWDAPVDATELFRGMMRLARERGWAR
jgi:glyoxylase-like metal-dependent hydrolase (beta-lactamase superfamily II)